VRRDQPDHIISWLLAGAHVVASKEMKRNGIPMDKYISVNWLNEVDIANIGPEAAKGLKRGTNVAGGQDVPVIIARHSDYLCNNAGRAAKHHKL
jgi:branched-chain amino acid transport system substrate-binding protein